MKRIWFGIFCMAVLYGVLSSSVTAAPFSAATPTHQQRWAWRKSFKNMELGNLAMAWNGSKLVFSVTQRAAPEKQQGDVIIGLDHAGAALTDWRIDKKASRLSLNGAGSKLLIETRGGSLLFYDKWDTSKEAVPLPHAAPGAALSPRGELIINLASTSAQGAQALDTSGAVLWSYPEQSLKNPFFPFISQERQVVWTSKTNELLLTDGEKTVWKAPLTGTPVSLASSFLEGGVIAVATGGEKGELGFYNEKGALTGSAPFRGNAVSLSCSDKGNACAVLANGPEGQRLSVYTPKGKELWRYNVKTGARSPSSLVVADHGQVVIAGFEERGKWSLRAWDIKGKPLWTAPVEGGLADFKVSWNGKRIAVITKDGRIAFFDLAVKK